MTSEPAPDRITVTFRLTTDDYASYVTAMNRRAASPVITIAYLAAWFCAIPVALFFRWLELRGANDVDVANTVGWASLSAFFLGMVAAIAAGFVVRKISIKKYMSETLNAFEPKTATLDRDGITVTGQVSQSMWRWPAITRFTRSGNLFLFWIGSTAGVIPCRSFGGDSECQAAQAFVQARLAEAKSAAGSPVAPR